MSGQFPDPSSAVGAVPAPILPSVERLVRRRAGELATERPRRRIVLASSMGGVAVAAACAVLVLVLGSTSGGGLLSPQRAVAAVAQSLESNGVLHWVRQGDTVRSSGPTDGGSSSQQSERVETRTEEDWIDLETGDAYHVTTVLAAGRRAARNWESWSAPGVLWVRTPDPEGAEAAVSRLPRPEGPDALTIADEVRRVLDRAGRGQAEIAEAGEEGGMPLVVVTDRSAGGEQRVWVTREASPQVVKLVTMRDNERAGELVTSTMTTQTWEVLPRTAESLRHVQVPPDVAAVKP